MKYPRWMRGFAVLLLTFVVLEYAVAAVTQIDAATQIQGILAVVHGGTGATAATGSGNVVLATGPTISSLMTTSDQTIGQNSLLITVANDTTTGTTVNLLAKLTATGKAIIAATSDTSGEIGIVEAGAGTSGNASITTVGVENCVADNSTTIGDYIGIGTTTAGRCKDIGATRPTSGQILGRALSSVSAGSNLSVLLFGVENMGSNTFTQVYNETPTGSINNSNVTFTLVSAPNPSGSLQCYLNGVWQEAGGNDFTLSSNTITYGTAPNVGKLRCNYTH